MSDPRLRHRDRRPGLNRDYYAGGDFDDDEPQYYGSQSPPRSRRYEDPPPRRGKSERRRPPSPDFADDPYRKPSQRHSRRADPKYERPPPQVVNSGRRPRAGSMTPPYAPEAPQHDISSRRDRDRDRDRDHRQRHSKRSSIPPGEPYDGHYAAAMDPRGGRPPKEYRGEPDSYSRRRSKHSPPPMEPRSRGRDSYEPRSRGRDYPPPSHPDDRYGVPPRRHRSQTRDMSPPRGRPPTTHAGRPRGGNTRRNSMPASTRTSGNGTAAATGAAAGAAAAAKNPWWKNPMVQAGARQAFTAGAQAAIRSKDDKGPWMGPKGAKIATAALSAAFVDGFLGSKRPDGH